MQTTEAAGAGFYESPGWAKKYPRLQLLPVADLPAALAELTTAPDFTPHGQQRM